MHNSNQVSTFISNDLLKEFNKYKNKRSKSQSDALRVMIKEYVDLKKTERLSSKIEEVIEKRLSSKIEEVIEKLETLSLSIDKHSSDKANNEATLKETYTRKEKSEFMETYVVFKQGSGVADACNKTGMEEDTFLKMLYDSDLSWDESQPNCKVWVFQTPYCIEQIRKLISESHLNIKLETKKDNLIEGTVISLCLPNENSLVEAYVFVEEVLDRLKNKYVKHSAVTKQIIDSLKEGEHYEIKNSNWL